MYKTDVFISAEEIKRDSWYFQIKGLQSYSGIECRA